MNHKSKGKIFFTSQCKGKKYFAPTKLWLYFIITMSVYLLMVFITIPTLNRLANGLEIIDVLPFYDGEYVVRLLEYLESEGRHYYLYKQLPIDMIYPLLYAFTYRQILKHFIDKLNLKRIKWVVFLPILAAVIDSLFTDLQPTLNRQMQATKYGNALNYIFLTCEFSFADDAWVKTNFIIADTDNKLTSQKAWELLHERFSAEEIEEHRYFLRNRFEIGGLRKDTGKAEIIFHFEKEFSDLCHREQKQKISEYFLTALRVFAQKQKKINYNFELMLADFERIVKDWQK